MATTLSQFLKQQLDLSALVVEEFPLGNSDPLSVYKQYRNEGIPSFLLEVKEGTEYGYAGFDPILVLETRQGNTSLIARDKTFRTDKDPLSVIREILDLLGQTPLIGFMAYEAVRYFENLPKPKCDNNFPDFYFALHNLSYNFDYARQIIIKRQFNFSSMYRCNVTSVQAENDGSGEELSDVEFERGVECAKRYVEAGDAFQIVLSREFRTKTDVAPLAVYQKLKERSPTPFMYLLEAPEYSFVGATPERLVSVKGGLIETMPIAGTRGRNKGIPDYLLEKELMEDPKEEAEHMMLVDMGRNDIGSVSIAGSVTVAELKRIRRYPHITHLVSKVRGVLRVGMDALDALKASFPAGTLTGAPKIRAMEIIHEIENSPRGLYGGAVVMFQGKFECDAFIAIRTAFFRDGIAAVRTGAGIVYDSIPRNESEETRHKARAILQGLKDAEEEAHVSDHR